jgi:transcriptional regulator with XRE-family HTH domain
MSISSSPDQQPFRVYTTASLGHAIKHYRQQAGLTQEQLAEQVGIDRTYLSRLEKGEGTEQLRRVIVLLRRLGVRATLQHEDW